MVIPHIPLPVLILLGKATIILLLALAATRTMQRTSAGARHLVWLVTLATLALVPALTAWGPVKVPMLQMQYRVASTDERVASSEYSGAGLDAPIPVTAASPAATPPGYSLLATRYPPLATRYSPSTLLLAVWSLVALGILASLAWSGLAVRRIVRNASPLEDEAWRTPLYEVADRMGLQDAPRLLKSDEAKMPFACGIVTPTIVLPADCDAWSLDRRRAVLLHELAHVRRHDLLGHTLGRLVCAAYWFHPLVWTAARQLRAESERACDDLALSCGTRATDYAEHLLDIVTSVRRDATPSVALAMARRKEFEGRMLAILDPELRRASPTRRQSAALIAALALVALGVGAVSPVARAAEAAQPAVTAGVPAGMQDTVAAHDDDADEAVPAIAVAQATHHDTSLGTEVRARAESSTPVKQIVRESTSSIVAGVTSAVLGELLQNADRNLRTFVSSTASASASATARAALRDLGDASQSKDERAALLAKVLRSDTSATLRRVAAWGLNEYADDAVASSALAAALRGDADARVREMAAWSLAEGSSRSGTAVDALSAALRSDADEKVRATAAWALGELGDRSAVDALVGALSSPSAAVRMRALWAIGSVEPKEAPRAVTALLRDPEPRVRRLAAWALFQIEDPSALGALQEALRTEENKDVQLAEIRAIGALGEHSVEALKALVESSDPRLRSMAVHALAGRDASGPWPWPWPEPRPYP